MQPALLSLAGASRCVNRHRGKGAVSVNTKPHLGLDQGGEDEVPRFFLWSRRRTVQSGNFFLVYWFCI